MRLIAPYDLDSSTALSSCKNYCKCSDKADSADQFKALRALLVDLNLFRSAARL